VTLKQNAIPARTAIARIQVTGFAQALMLLHLERFQGFVTRGP